MRHIHRLSDAACSWRATLQRAHCAPPSSCCSWRLCAADHLTAAHAVHECFLLLPHLVAGETVVGAGDGDLDAARPHVGHHDVEVRIDCGPCGEVDVGNGQREGHSLYQRIESAVEQVADAVLDADLDQRTTGGRSNALGLHVKLLVRYVLALGEIRLRARLQAAAAPVGHARIAAVGGVDAPEIELGLTDVFAYIGVPAGRNAAR